MVPRGGIVVYEDITTVHPLKIIQVYTPYTMTRATGTMVPSLIDTMLKVVRVIAVHALDRDHIDFPVKTGCDSTAIYLYIGSEPITICTPNGKGCILINQTIWDSSTGVRRG